MARLAGNNIVAFVGTTSQARARQFYGETLGLPLISEDNFALAYDAHGTTLRVTTVQHVTAAGYTVLGWDVPDIVNIVAELSAAGVVFERWPGMQQDKLGIWDAPSGARVAWFKDPEGNILSVTQFG